MSMTREDASDILSDEEISCLIGKFHGAKEALDLALSALRPVSREHVEKVWRGEWVCTPNMGVYDTICSKCGYCPGITFWDSDFCPACGSPMTDEAVDIIMERLGEVLYEQTSD